MFWEIITFIGTTFKEVFIDTLVALIDSAAGFFKQKLGRDEQRNQGNQGNGGQGNCANQGNWNINHYGDSFEINGGVTIMKDNDIKINYQF